uniref:Uncharacterized protein n=1 Tax=Glossina pallidipes TaxID=7398 RepID=A0A1A9ZBI6_GLOPL
IISYVILRLEATTCHKVLCEVRELLNLEASKIKTGQYERQYLRVLKNTSNNHYKHWCTIKTLKLLSDKTNNRQPSKDNCKDFTKLLRSTEPAVGNRKPDSFKVMRLKDSGFSDLGQHKI